MSERVIRGAAVIVGGRFVIRLIGLLNTLLVARLLTPDDFGLVAIGVVTMQILENVSDLSIGQTVIKFRDASSRMLQTLFTFSILKGAAVFVLMAAAAPFVASFYDDPRLVEVYIVLGVAAFIRSARNPKFFEFERELDFSKEIFAALMAKTLAVIASISIALVFRTYWAIIAGMIISISIENIMSYVMRPFRPGFSLHGFRKLLGFTGWITIAGAFTAINNKFGPLVLGRLLGTAPTGNFYVGMTLSDLVGRELALPMVKALYPGLSSLQNDPAQMNRAYLRGVEAMSMIVAPAAFGLAFLAEDMVTFVLGDGWPMAVSVVATVTPAYGLMSVLSGVQTLAMANGKVRPLVIRELFYFLLQMPLLVTATVLYGFKGAIWATAISSVCYIGLQSWLYAQVTGDKWWRPLWSAHRGILSVIPMAFWFFFFRPDIASIEELPIMGRILMDVVTGVMIYGGSVLILWQITGRPDGIEKQTILLLNKRITG